MYTKIHLNATEIEARRIALARALGVTAEEVEHERSGEFTCGRAEYMVLSDKEAGEELLENVRESAWAFRASFICSFCGLDQSGAESLEAMQAAKCESANPFILSLIERTEGGVEAFAEEAASADGRGHFLSSYDGEELELAGGLFAYRTN